ncbi:MAG: hypothetical protein IPK68_16200 [Bdellovibrionales bacterium]|nr:hypothetical protein [Bdellovibrionales bacterium]
MTSMWIIITIRSSHSEGFEKIALDFNTAAGPSPSVTLLYPKHREPAELNLRSPGSSSAWCSAHKGSAAAGRMFEYPGLLRFSSAGHPWSSKQESRGPVYS